MDIIKILKRRYSTKEFDKSKKIDSKILEQIKQLLQFPPSSTNIQPWYFIIAESDEAKARVAKATQGFYSFNETKVLDASAVILFATRVTADDDYLNHLSECEYNDGRFATEAFREQNHVGRKYFADMHKYDLKDQQHWMEKQTYLNAGNFLLGVATLGLDALPMEGCDLRLLNEEFDLIDKGFTASFLVAIGYHTESDFNAALPKSRLSSQEIMEVL